MSRTRDIADIMGKSEAVNPTNLKFLKLGDAGGDAANVVNVTVNGSGTSDKTASNRIEIGDAVVVVADGSVQSAGQQYTPHRFLNDSGMSGDIGQRAGGIEDVNNPYSNQVVGQVSYTAGAANYGGMPDVGKYIGGQKILFCWLHGYYALAQIAKLNSTGTSIIEWGQVNRVISQATNSNTTVGARNLVDYDVETDLRGNPTGYAYMAYNYYNRTGGSYSYNYHKGYGNVLYNDITDPNDMAVTVGPQHIWGSSSSSSSARQHDFPRVVYDPHNQAWAIFLHNRTGNGDIQCRYVKRTGMVGSHTNNIAAAIDGDDGRIFDAIYNVKDQIFHIVYIENANGAGLSHFSQATSFRVTNYDSSTMSLSGQLALNRSTTFASSNDYCGFDICYDSGAGCGVAAVVDGSDVGTVYTMKRPAEWDSSNASGNHATQMQSTQFGVNVDEIPLVAHIKGMNKNLVIWNEGEYQYGRFFTCDSNGGITMEDSSHYYPELPVMYGSTLEYIEDYDLLLRNQYFPASSMATYRPNQGTNTHVLLIYDPERREVTNVTPNNYLGIAQNAADSGQSVEVKVNGSIDTNQTGLSPGFTYYINEINGDLENNTNNGSVQAGIATAVGNLKVVSVYDSSA